jgi:shikimate dehydrogenase
MKHYGLLGEHLSHSFSPQIHALLGDYEYALYEKPPDEVADFLRAGDFDGLNVTIPYKKTVLPLCSQISENVLKVGSVNTIVRRPDGTLFGDNTDYDGFSYLLAKTTVGAAGKKVLILGSGGASLTVQTVLKDVGAGDIVTVSRNGDNNYENLYHHHDARLIVNTTPVGMYPLNGASLLDLSAFDNVEAVIDIVYNPAKTTLLLDAEDLGIPCVNGLPMLVAQARRAAELFTGRSISDAVIDEITDRIALQTRNIALIGMPGSGKSLTGKALAELLERPFYDTDALIVSLAGKSIPDIFSEDGEDAFRKMESDVLREVSKMSGAVISTGGGIVKRSDNRRLLRQNSTIVFLDRPLPDLSTDGRPLSQKAGVETLSKERLPLYNEWCDIKAQVDGVAETAYRIRRLLGL